MPVFVRLTTDRGPMVLNIDYVLEIKDQGDSAAISVGKGNEVSTYSVREPMEDLYRRFSISPRLRRQMAQAWGAIY